WPALVDARGLIEAQTELPLILALLTRDLVQAALEGLAMRQRGRREVGEQRGGVALPLPGQQGAQAQEQEDVQDDEGDDAELDDVARQPHEEGLHESLP